MMYLVYLVPNDVFVVNFQDHHSRYNDTNQSLYYLNEIVLRCRMFHKNHIEKINFQVHVFLDDFFNKVCLFFLNRTDLIDLRVAST